MACEEADELAAPPPRAPAARRASSCCVKGGVLHLDRSIAHSCIIINDPTTRSEIDTHTHTPTGISSRIDRARHRGPAVTPAAAATTSAAREIESIQTDRHEEEGWAKGLLGSTTRRPLGPLEERGGHGELFGQAAGMCVCRRSTTRLICARAPPSGYFTYVCYAMHAHTRRACESTTHTRRPPSPTAGQHAGGMEGALHRLQGSEEGAETAQGRGQGQALAQERRGRGRRGRVGLGYDQCGVRWKGWPWLCACVSVLGGG
jgi:hypothetical protein